MKNSSLKSYLTFIIDHMDELTPAQYTIFCEKVLSRLPLAAIHTMTVNNKGEKIKIGFKKPDGECPFCSGAEGL